MSKAIDRLHQQLSDAAASAVQGQRVRIPEAGRYLWMCFVDLAACRQRDAMGNPMAIGFTEIEAYSRIMGKLLRPIDVQGLRAMDRAALEASRQHEATPLPDPKRHGPKLSPALFDAVFQ